LDNARYLISEAYCRIHQRIDIACVFLPLQYPICSMLNSLNFFSAIFLIDSIFRKTRERNGSSI
jgi:hypothetical protein